VAVILTKDKLISWHREMKPEDLVRARKTLRISQADLTDMLGVPAKLIGSVEKGVVDMPAHLDFAVRYLLIRKSEGLL